MRYFSHAFIILMFISCHPVSDANHATKTLGGNEYRFEELPGFFVEFVSEIPDSETLRPFCSGAYIGDGYVITAAHCLSKLLICPSYMEEDGIKDITSFGLHVLTNVSNSHSGKRQRHYISFSDIKSVVIHKDFFSVDKKYSTTAAGDLDYLFARKHDIALMKIDPNIPVAASVHLPADKKYSVPSLVHGTEVWVYGVSNNKDGNYYSGTAQVDKQSKIIRELPSNERIALDQAIKNIPPYKSLLEWEKETPNSIAPHYAYLSTCEDRSLNNMYSNSSEQLDISFLRFKKGASSAAIISVDRGDSGGPVVVSSGESEWILLGVNHGFGVPTDVDKAVKVLASKGRGNMHNVNLAVSVFAHMSWINDAKLALNDLERYSVPSHFLPPPEPPLMNSP